MVFSKWNQRFFSEPPQLIQRLSSHGYTANLIQLLHAVTGSMAFCTPEGKNGTRGKAEEVIFPRGCTKPMDPKSQHATIVLLYLGNMIIPLLKVLLSSSNINYDEYQ